MWPGQQMRLAVKEVLFAEKSKYQDILVFDSETYGKVLVLDGVIQITERDQCAYQEMICHVPMLAHPNPENVLIIGGGDGGVVTNVLKHKSVKKLTICEIDELVIAQSKQHFKEFSNSWNDPRLTINIQDANIYLDDKNSEFDVIIVDSSDPIGPAEVLFQKPFFAKLSKALKPEGFASTQAECIWLNAELISDLFTMNADLFPHIDYSSTMIPTYPCGQIGFLLLGKKTSARTPVRSAEESLLDSAASLRYYDSDIHSASFVLPKFVQQAINKAKQH